MKRHLTIGEEAIDSVDLLKASQVAPGMGAVLHFAGVVRNVEEADVILGIEYEAFLKMAERQFELLFDQIEQRWPIDSVRLVHRVGFVPAGEPSLWVELIAPHRGEAFLACQFLIDEMKRVVPIWKKVIKPKADLAHARRA